MWHRFRFCPLRCEGYEKYAGRVRYSKYATVSPTIISLSTHRFPDIQAAPFTVLSCIPSPLGGLYHFQCFEYCSVQGFLAGGVHRLASSPIVGVAIKYPCRVLPYILHPCR